MTRRLFASTLLALLLAGATEARAGIIFSNFGSGLGYNTGSGNFIGNGQDGSGSNYAQGDTFTASANYTVGSLQIALSNYFSTNTDTLLVSLVTDSGSNSPGGTVLTSWSIAAGTLGTFGNNNAPLDLTAASGVTLTMGDQYWVTVADTTSGANDSNVWNWNSTGDTSSQAISTDGGSTWFSPSGLTPGAYQLNTPAAAVPEPSSLYMMLGSVGIGLLGDQWRRRRIRSRRPVTKRPQAEALEERVVMSTTFTWTQANAPAAGVGTMLQLPNGNVMMVGDNGPGGVSNTWNVLQPSATGSYANNSNPSSSLMTQSRLYFASNVLPNGNVFVLGGEYSGPSGSQNETNTGEIFNASTSTWSSISNFPQPNFGDSPSVLLNNGLILLGTGAGQGLPYGGNGDTYLYNPTSSAITAMVNGTSTSIAAGDYSAGIPSILSETTTEEGLTKLPNGEVLRYSLWLSVYLGASASGNAQLFDPATGSWQDISPANGTAKGTIPLLGAVNDKNQKFWMETGPSLLLPNGNVFFVSGGNSNTALYNPSTNTWSAGPLIPAGYTADDAPGAVLPNGDVIFTADSALVNGEYTGPTGFFDYSPSAGKITQLTGSNAPGDYGLAFGSYPDRMLVLPTGQLMFSDGNSNQVWVGTPSGAPAPQWRPVVQSVTGGAGTYTLSGLRLNGMSAGAAYGDDAGMDENYPIVRLMNGSGNVYYATTSNWSNLGVATGSTPETVTFTLPSGMPAGRYSLIVSGAGISSFPVAFNVPNPSAIAPASVDALLASGAIGSLDGVFPPPKHRS